MLALPERTVEFSHARVVAVVRFQSMRILAASAQDEPGSDPVRGGLGGSCDETGQEDLCLLDGPIWRKPCMMESEMSHFRKT